MKPIVERLQINYNVVKGRHILSCPVVMGFGSTFEEAREDFEKKFHAWMFENQVSRETVSQNSDQN